MKKEIIIAAAALLTFMTFSFLSIFIQTGRNSAAVIIEIKQGMPANKVAAILRYNNVIRSRTSFKVLSFVTGANKNIQAGRYKFKAHEPLFNVLMKLKKGETVRVEPLRVSFPEGTSIYKMGSFLEKTGYKGSMDLRRFTNSTFTKRMSNEFIFLKDAKDFSLEGFLFPDTYIFDNSVSAEALARLMLKRFDKVIWKYWNDNKKDAKLAFYPTLILASIIEKEAQKAPERPIISSVYYNRLNMNMPLAACPTVKYALDRPTKRVFSYQLKIDSPFNTYRKRGFPPTPICNPGLESFKAAIYPAKTNYLYFVAKKDGSHIFSSSWAEHQRARRMAR